MNTFMDALTKNEKSYTLNDATAYRTSGNALVDLNFSVPSLRQAAVDFYGKSKHNRYFYSADGTMDAVEALRLFITSYEEDPLYTMKWLMYVRHIKIGLGERDVFRMMLTKIGDLHPEMALQFIIGTELWNYGRWDDVLRIFFDTTSTILHDGIGELIANQFRRDVMGCGLGDSISLLAKWMPSNNTSSKQKRSDAAILQSLLHLSAREYRKILSRLREYLSVVDRQASLNQWNDINYNHVPSKANLKYRNAFLKHDEERRKAYLTSLQKGDDAIKINANSMFLYDIVQAYVEKRGYWGEILKPYDETLEQLWSAQEAPKDYEDILIIRDGSASMCQHLTGNSSVTALSVADSIALYCSQHNKNESFRNRFITFSNRPQMVDISMCQTLRDKLRRLHRFDDYSNTDIEATFDLILDTVVKKHLRQEELPLTCLIISDMQFDQATQHEDNTTVIESCRRKFEALGYTMPRLIFWNVSVYAHNTIPVQMHPSGVILVSGFSKYIVDMVVSGELNPETALKAELDVKCGIVDEVLQDYVKVA
ncbi:DUF2828 family protein [Veillonella infantium]|uniref:DUF2828 family protein n=1 Tax=Veillonella infantium TaxID=1911679 RepID=UPI0026EDF10C|nr:DUF2828 family protein [Veillonella infantium]